MTRIDFYFNAEAKIAVACKLTAKAVEQGRRVLIYAPDETLARTVDRALWTFQALAFVPHCMAFDALAAETPVLIARDTEGLAHDEVLLNLHAEAPPAFSRFHRLLEIVGQEQEDRDAARSRFKFYRDRGYELHHHDLAKAGT